MEQRIKHLFRKYLSNSCTAEELDEFLLCIRMSENDEALRKIIEETYESVLIGSDTYVNQSGDLIIPGTNDLILPIVKRKKKMPAWAIASLAGITVVMFLSVMLFLKKEKQKTLDIASLKKTRTERAEYKYILLPDSTQVWLNAGSELDYPGHFDGNTREVILSGEAYFDVKHAAEHPFIIHTGEISTTVLGTAFNINAYSDRRSVRVSVSRGKVRVSRGDLLIATLVKDQEIKVDQKKNPAPEQIVKTNSVAAWQQGNMVYDDETLGEIIEDLQRVYNADIQVQNVNMRSIRLSTRFRRELGIGQALEILCKLTDSKLSEKNGTYFIQ